MFFTVTALFLPEKSVSHEPSLFPFRVIQLASDSASNYRPYLPYLPHSSLALAHLEIERICRLPPLLLARSSSFARDTPSLEPNSRYVATHRLLARKRDPIICPRNSRVESCPPSPPPPPPRVLFFATVPNCLEFGGEKLVQAGREGGRERERIKKRVANKYRSGNGNFRRLRFYTRCKLIFITRNYMTNLYI